MKQPLAERMRPQTLKDVVGQAHLLESGQIIRQIIERKQPTSLILWGPPGSGKTTLARLFEFPTLVTLLRHRGLATYRELCAAVAECEAITGEHPKVVGCRLSMETDYRDFWEFPYSEGLKLGLMTALIQARSVLAWLRHLSTAIPQSPRDRCTPSLCHAQAGKSISHLH